MSLTAEIVEDVDALGPLTDAWDALADLCRAPCAAAAWMTAWAREVAPQARLRVVAVRDGDEVVGIAPFALVRGPAGTRRLELLAAGTASGITPLAAPGREDEVARAVAAALAGTAPRADELALDGVPASSPWPALLARHWPGARPRLLRREQVLPEPLIALAEPSYDAWLAAKSSNFRQQVRRAGRKLEARGGRVRRTASPAELGPDLAAFVTLHRARWEERGGTGVLDDRVEAMLRRAGPDLLAAGRLDLWCVDVDGRTVGAQLWLAAGGTVTMWLSGSDDSFADVRPTNLIMAAVVEDAYARGLRPVSLGPGGQDYKRRFADGETAAAWWTLPLPGPRIGLALGGQGARALRREAARRLSAERKARLRAAAARVRPG
jgi:CelD/BcsL family acetyltransferase involved in cellulose biosynthesis